MKLEGTIKHGISLSTGCVSDEAVIAFGPIGSYVDMSHFYTKEQTDALLDSKEQKRFVVNVTEVSGSYSADKTFDEVDVAIANGKQVVYILNHSEYYVLSFHVPTQCSVAVRVDHNEPMMDSVKTDYLYHSITGITHGETSLAKASDIPTNVSELTNDAGYITSLKTVNNASLVGEGNLDVHDIVLGKLINGSFYVGIKANNRWVWSMTPVTPNVDKLYEDITTNKVYRWDNVYVELSVQDLSGLADTIGYDSAEKKLYLMHGSTVLSWVDATVFIKDGMVDDVNVSELFIEGQSVLCLNITFNTESGKADIHIPISEIFNASNYYTKGEIDRMGFLTAEADPVFSASAAAGITQQNIQAWSAKQDALVNGTNIKTINSAPLLGSGNLQTQMFSLFSYVEDSWECDQSLEDLLAAYNAGFDIVGEIREHGNSWYGSVVEARDTFMRFMWIHPDEGNNAPYTVHDYWVLVLELRDEVVEGFTTPTVYQRYNKKITQTIERTPTEGSENLVMSGGVYNALLGKVDKETGKGLSTEDYTTAEKTKLSGIAAGAEMNVQADWSQSNSSSDDYIKNKPTLAAVATSGDYTDLSNTPTFKTVNGASLLGSGDIDADDVVVGKLENDKFYTVTISGIGTKTFSSTPVTGNYNKLYADILTFKLYWYDPKIIQFGSDEVHYKLIGGGDETDPIFTASAAHGITSADITNWNGKADSSDLANYYTKTEINAMIGDIETLLANI